MKRVTCLGALLLFLCWWQVRAGSRGVMFVYAGNAGDVAILKPIVAASIGVQLVKGAGQARVGEVLTCQADIEKHNALIDGEKGEISVLLLRCNERTFAVKSIHFEE